MSMAVICSRWYLKDYFNGTTSTDMQKKYMVIIFAFAGAVLMFAGLNMDYNWIDIQVVDGMSLVKIINGIPMTYDPESHTYMIEVITPYHTDETLHE